MVIAAGPLDEIVPLEPAAMPGRVVIQWDKEDCADLGIIKVDLLGLGMLAVLEEAIPLIAGHEDVEVDLAHLPPDDPAVYADATQGRHDRRLPGRKPRPDGDAAADEAAHVLRPGGRGRDHPARSDRRPDGQSVPGAAQRARSRVTYAHPSLEPILRRTLGVPLFQEQLLRIAMTAAGFSGGEAEELRRAMGFKRSRGADGKNRAAAARGDGEKRDHRQGRRRNHRSITSFALYGFPESHAASFALIAYASAYLKCHHAAAFCAAMLNCYPLGFYHPATLVKDAQRHGVEVRPIDVTRSNWRCTIGKSGGRLALRLGLKYIGGLREETGLRIESERRVRRLSDQSPT